VQHHLAWARRRVRGALERCEGLFGGAVKVQANATCTASSA
jgi:hypothetical protein